MSGILVFYSVGYSATDSQSKGRFTNTALHAPHEDLEGTQTPLKPLFVTQFYFGGAIAVVVQIRFYCWRIHKISQSMVLPVLVAATVTGKGVSDSFLIAQYLDEAYPDTPRVVPNGTRVLQAAFVDDFQAKFMPLFAVLGAKFRTFFPQEFVEGQKKAYGEGAITPELPLKEQEANWDKVKGSFDTLGNVFVKDEKFVMGDKPTLADFTIVAWLWNVQVAYGENSSE
ncbi:hypothetical protein V5O48_005440 [Marasmius crinis-equi]|uniref:GST C-terminal domain-containing protein n=1 Tax=Marasmius crinis-equi TaxID=585013 RepID=A0ABR3FMA0_9AGAR